MTREKEALFAELSLADPGKPGHRPIVVTPLGARLWRPAERVREILPNT